MYIINIESEIYWNERRQFREKNRDNDYNDIHYDDDDDEDNVDDDDEEEEEEEEEKEQVNGYGDDIDDGSYKKGEQFRRRR